MIVLCRADASNLIGVGHIMRTLTLASEIKKNGGVVDFYCRNHEGNLEKYITSLGFKCHISPVINNTILGASIEEDALQTDYLASYIGAEWIVADHYGIDINWEEKQSTKLLVLEDMPTRKHSANILLNQNSNAEIVTYRELVSLKTKCLLGPKYALLRPNFSKIREFSLNRRKKGGLKNILISMGGSDIHNSTEWALKLLIENINFSRNGKITINVILGPNFQYMNSLYEVIKKHKDCIKLIMRPKDIATLMANADLAIGAGGMTSLERCCLGLPSIIVPIAENQKDIAMDLDNKKVCKSVNFHDDEAFLTAIKYYMENSDELVAWSERAAEICDGLGAPRVVEEMKAS